ncbi:MAG: hypothetical protein A2381_15395 [Bdellovibrionales bacterium RIFOXYB1_FULL_37_110]|nr:MAG: hypothetical protein A2417_07245 [Bdellovibrionales bacterium RIFOXYC1_FULL_37_79]OFZ57007.1 MAG: hypothetical protein A2381_15395 [Bdellovibrionales bacterium RIFOXYB1_FULL_37_110]OFZ64006.1 MAG: hypothetical protein A2577_16010 [Bdellovibrionales bacterium RIFOXYD1_FULL_36_51]
MSKLILTIVSLVFTQVLYADNHINVDNCDVKIFGINIRDKVVCDGSSNQFCGHEKSVTFTVGVDKNKLDAPVKRVGFKGTNDGQAYETSFPATNEHHTGLWDIEFSLARHIAWNKFDHVTKGSFFVETTDGTYYWLKYKNNSDFEFDSNLSSNLSFYDNRCSE